MSEIINLPISNITQDPEIQIRATSIDWLIVDAYIESAKQGAIFPPVVVFFDGDNYWLADGNHRLEVARRIGQEWIDAEVKQGGKREAIPESYTRYLQVWQDIRSAGECAVDGTKQETWAQVFEILMQSRKKMAF